MLLTNVHRKVDHKTNNYHNLDTAKQASTKHDHLGALQSCKAGASARFWEVVELNFYNHYEPFDASMLAYEECP